MARIKKEGTQDTLDQLNGSLNANQVGYIRLIKLGSENVLEAAQEVALVNGDTAISYTRIYGADKLVDINTFLAGVMYERNKDNA